MQIKILLMSTWLCFFTFQAFSTPLANIGPNSNPQDVCSLPAPLGFHVESIGPDYLVVGWILANPNQGIHRVKVFRASDNLLLATADVPAGQFQATINNLPTATDFSISCCELCSNGDAGTPVFITQNGIILDLIVKGYTETNKEISLCQIDPSHSSCTLESNFRDTYFEVVRTAGEQVSRRFLVKYYLQGLNPRYQIIPAPANGSGIKFLCPNATDEGNGCLEIPAVKLKGYLSNGDFSDIVSLKCAGPVQTSSLVSTAPIQAEYRIQRLDFPAHNKPGGGLTTDRNETPTNPFENLFLSPNPFTESISLDFYLPPGEALEAQLFSPSGQKVYAQHLDAGQTSYTLTPSNLPSGLYFLRLESGGEVRTIKMVKSE